MTSTPDTEPPPPADADEPAGLARVRMMADGRHPVPGMWQTLVLRLVEVRPGHVTVEVAPDSRHANGNDIAHGGLVATMVDSSTGAAVSTTLAAGQRIATVDLQVDYHRPVALDGGPIVARAVVAHTGHRLAHADCTVRVGEAVVATGRAVYAVADRTRTAT